MKNIILIIVFLLSFNLVSSAQTWNSTGGGNWGTAGNWNPTTVPDAINAIVTLGPTITTNQDIRLNGNRTIGTLNFNSAHNYTLNNNTLTFNVYVGSTTLNVTNSGDLIINSKINIADNMIIDQNGTGLIKFNSAISGTNNLTMKGSGTTTFTGNQANTYSGQTIIDGGTLSLNKRNNINAIAGSSIKVNSGATLLLNSDNQIKNGTSLILNGGTFLTGTSVGHSETLNTLTLSSSSTISLGTGTHQISFANSSLISWTGTLTISNWAGTIGNSGTAGQIFFGVGGLTSAQLAQIKFDGYGNGAMILPSGELVPVPEVRKVIAILLLICVIVLWEYSIYW